MFQLCSMDSFYSHAYSNMSDVDKFFSNSDEEMFWKMNKQHQMVSTTIVESANIWNCSIQMN
jgi:hypothetical protein